MVELRAKKLSGGKFHLFVDVYENGQRRKKYLKIYVSEDYTRPIRDAKGNMLYDKKGRPEQHKILTKDKANWDTAEKVKTEIESQLNKNKYGFDSTDYSATNFTKYFEELVVAYQKKDFRKGEACLKLFKSFNNGRDVLCREIDEDYVIDFRDHLVSNTNGDTP